MDAKELAAKLNGIEYRGRVDRVLMAQAKTAGLVVVTGGSDDLAEFDGAIRDEVGAGDETKIRVDREGIVPDWDNVDHDDIDEARKFFQREGKGGIITTLWCAENGVSWTYKTDLPHETFNVMEDGKVYCRGIVFSLNDIPA